MLEVILFLGNWPSNYQKVFGPDHNIPLEAASDSAMKTQTLAQPN